jgi:glycerol-3-phosphate dehydrogenase (NAD(P)+)
VIAVIGAGAMGSALAILHDRAASKTALLGTNYDDVSIDACRLGLPHPALGVMLAASIDCHSYGEWPDVLPNADRIVLGVSSDGLADVAVKVAHSARSDAVFIVATKGWDPATLRAPSEILNAAGIAPERVVVLGGPALAPEIVAGAPTAMVAASVNGEVAEAVAATLRAGRVSASTTDDVAGVEIAAAYKNVTAIAVGMCEGLSERLPESVFVHRFANARSAVFAQGLNDMVTLCRGRGGRIETIVGLAGAGDLYVTCLGGRNGSMGKLLGSGQTPEQAERTIGSTVEGVANTKAALAIAEQLGVRLPAAEAVDSVLSGRTSPDEAIASMIGALEIRA